MIETDGEPFAGDAATTAGTTMVALATPRAADDRRGDAEQGDERKGRDGSHRVAATNDPMMPDRPRD